MAGYENNSGGFCRRCGAPLVGAFCNRCGQPVGYPTASPANARCGWQTPKRSTGALVALVVSGVLALALFVAVPLGVIVHNLLQSGQSTAGGNGSPGGGEYDGYGEDYWNYYENYRDYFNSYEEYRDYFDSFGDEYGGLYDEFALNETSSTRVDVLSSQRNSEHEALDAGQILVTVEVQLTNIDYSSTITYDPAAFALASPTGNLTPAIVEGPFYNFSTALRPGSLLPGGYTSGLVTFLVPEDDPSFTLYYTDPNDGDMLQVPMM